MRLSKKIKRTLVGCLSLALAVSAATMPASAGKAGGYVVNDSILSGEELGLAEWKFDERGISLENGSLVFDEQYDTGNPVLSRTPVHSSEEIEEALEIRYNLTVDEIKGEKQFGLVFGISRLNRDVDDEGATFLYSQATEKGIGFGLSTVKDGEVVQLKELTHFGTTVKNVPITVQVTNKGAVRVLIGELFFYSGVEGETTPDGYLGFTSSGGWTDEACFVKAAVKSFVAYNEYYTDDTVIYTGGRTMEYKVLSRHTDGPFRYQAWPTVAKAADGTLFVATSGHRLNHLCPYGKDLMYVSKNEGETWSCPIIVNDTYLDDRDAGLLAWGDGNLLLTYFSTPVEAFQTYDLEDGKPHVNLSTPLAMGMRKLWQTLPADQLRPGCWTRISRDNGVTWSEPRRAPVSSPHSPCRLKDGTLLFVGSIVENGTYESDDYTKRIQMFKSTDDGATWQYLSHIPMPEGADQACHEPHAIQMANGDILVAVRYENTFTPVMKSLRVYTTISHDNGKTWEKSMLHEDQHGAPPHLLQHSSGAVILVYSRRLEPMGQYAQVSFDYGKTWTAEVKLSPDTPTGTPAWDHGYPSSVELNNGDILTVYYQKCPGDDYCSLHQIRWSLDEIK